MAWLRSEARVVLAAMDNITIKYTMKVVKVAHRVPFGMALLGDFKSPESEAPARMPAVALICVSNPTRVFQQGYWQRGEGTHGNKMPNNSLNVSAPEYDGLLV